MALLREDEGLAIALVYKPPAPEAARQRLDRFHDEPLMVQRPAQGSFLPVESPGLEGLGAVNGRVAPTYGEAMQPGKEVTLEVDAHLVETSKANAQYCYEGYKAYQPMAACRAETAF
ncbi:MAG TPA: hypothetical protein VFR55_03850 [Dehalococcoidia bacterium]|nr:hypothetical protein [Dehalococcoidia bacterium]